MDEEHKDIEDEMEELEEEIKDDSKEVPSNEPQAVVKAKEQPTERYTAFYQEARIGIIDTVTKEVKVEGLRDVPTAELEALKLNKLDRIETASGV